MNISAIAGKRIFILALVCSCLVSGDLRAEIQRMDRKTALESISSPDPKVRKSAVISLVSGFGSIPDSALEPILLIAKDEDLWSRAWAMSALEKMGPKVLERAQPVILAALAQEPEVAVNAAIVAGKFKMTAAVTPLKKLLEEEKAGLKHFAAEGLSRIGGEEAKAAYLGYVKSNLPLLMEKLDSQDLTTAAGAEEFISKMATGMARLSLQNSPEGALVSSAKTKAKQKMKEMWDRVYSTPGN